MMKKMLTLLLIIMTFTLISCNKTDDTPDVVVSIFPYYSVLNEITDNELDILLLAPIGSEIHNFEPTSQDKIKINDTKLFIYTDDHVDSWISGMSISENTKVVEFEEGYVGHHKWTNPKLLIDLINNTIDTLVEIKPSSSDKYIKNANTYISTLTEIDEQLTSLLINQEIYYAGHNAFDSMEDVYNFNVNALDNSIEPGEITSKQRTALVEKIIEHNISTLFFEELVEQNEVNKIKQLVESKSDINLEVKILHGYHNISLEQFNKGITYLDLLNQNLINLQEALK